MKLSTILVAGCAASVLPLNGSAFAQQQSQQYQQQGDGEQLSNREVRQFMSQIERDVNQMVQSRDLSRLRQWTQNNVADHAVLNRTNSIETEGRSRMTSSVTITKPDLIRLQRFVLSSMSDKLNNVDDFRFNIQVMNVEPVGDSAAIVKSRITERATLTSRQGGSRFSEERDNGRGGNDRFSEERDGSPGGKEHFSDERDHNGQRDRDFTTGQGQRSDMQGGEDFDEPRQPRGRHPGRGQQGGVQLESQATCTHLVERNRDGGRLQIGMGVCDATTEAQF